ncbi:SusC/RagA family TonB-linked outer membrane protein [Niastella yeongjuensis]|uniref:SusC/RagA family TonB-linked outer membrane protein n=1 Tax=Niastella yeongjuensis TaxID=354355 RepID=A0A1V9EMN6_9BACT|nr:TonB-dependent receptor [Niastella yeongjuensis]OQP47386.1 SusC/RagA family TonB-linked outer membrane protein [Niastella yeongjuensis]SEN81684.1 TonB-linked outer membrane protein, SusC/RagA family [Niastella yeongjuensis]
MTTRITFVVLSLILPIFLFAQSRQIKGAVTDDKGSPLSGVSVLVKGTHNGSTTDGTGKFIFTVPGESGKVTLVFSYLGYKQLETTADGINSITIQLQKEDNSLEDVVVIGYGTAKKKDLTGSVSSVTSKDLKDVPVNSVAEALAGRLAGVQVSTTEGRPGADILIRVRGGGSISQDNSPLYIVDGIPLENALSIISPQEIESINVLKDAASTAVYGARGANGVVVITTKGGRDMKTRVTYDGYAGVRKIVNKLDVMNPYEFIMYQYQRYNGSADDRTAFEKTYGRWEDLDIYKNMPFTDWQDEVFGRNAMNNTHVVGVTGGSKASTFNLTLSNTKEDGIMLESGFKRTLASFKFDHRATDKLRMGFNARYSRQRVDGVGTSSTGSQGTNRLRNAVRYKPFIAPGEEGNNTVDEFDPNYNTLTNLTNPVMLAHNELKYDYRNDVYVNGYFSYDIIPGLTAKTVIGVTGGNARTNIYNGAVTSVARSNANMPVVNLNTGDNFTLTNSNTITYTKAINDHKFDVLAGQETYQTKSNTFNSTVKWIPVDLTVDQAFQGIQKAMPPSGGIQDPPTTSQNETRLVSYFGRANYYYKNKFYVTGTLRYDGSNKFLYKNAFGAFPAAAAAWTISQEPFMQNFSAITFLKLRASIGTSGNNRIDNDLFRTTFGTNTSSYAFEEAVTPGLAPPALANPGLKWETTISRNVGLDFTILRNRINGSIDYYYNNTRDLLLSVKVPVTSGYTDQIQNVGKTRNTGVELQLNSTIMNTKDFSWNAAFNISTNKNTIISLGNYPLGNPLNSYLVRSGWVNDMYDFKVEVGKPIGQFYGYVTDGFYTPDDFDYNSSTKAYTLKAGVPNSSGAALGNRNPQPGDLKLKKLSDSKDSLIGESDKTVLGNAQPRFYGGLNQQFTYKGFDLSVFVNWSVGNKEYNANKLEFTTTFQYKDNNMLSLMNDRYKLFDENGQRVTDPATLNEMNVNAKYWTPSLGNYFLHSFAIEDASFLRISNLTFGYSLPQSLLNKTKVFTRFRVYATVNNLYTFTKYTGYDPEANTRRSNPLTPGIDYAAYPRSRFFLAGVNVGF